MYLWYAKTILEIWACPTDILLRKNLVSDDTKKDIWLSIKNWAFRQDMYEFWLNERYVKNLFDIGDEDDDVTYLTDHEKFRKSDQAFFNDEKYGFR